MLSLRSSHTFTTAKEQGRKRRNKGREKEKKLSSDFINGNKINVHRTNVHFICSIFNLSLLIFINHCL